MGDLQFHLEWTYCVLSENAVSETLACVLPKVVTGCRSRESTMDAVDDGDERATNLNRVTLSRTSSCAFGRYLVTAMGLLPVAVSAYGLQAGKCCRH